VLFWCCRRPHPNTLSLAFLYSCCVGVPFYDIALIHSLLICWPDNPLRPCTHPPYLLQQPCTHPPLLSNHLHSCTLALFSSSELHSSTNYFISLLSLPPCTLALSISTTLYSSPLISTTLYSLLLSLPPCTHSPLISTTLHSFYLNPCTTLYLTLIFY